MIDLCFPCGKMKCVFCVYWVKLSWDPLKIVLNYNNLVDPGYQDIRSNYSLCPGIRILVPDIELRCGNEARSEAICRHVCVQRCAHVPRAVARVGERRRCRAHTWTMPRPHFSASFMIVPSSFKSRLLPHVLITMRLSATNMLLSLRAEKRRTHQWHWHWQWHGSVVPKMTSCGEKKLKLTCFEYRYDGSSWNSF